MNKLALSLGVAGTALVGSYMPSMAQAADTIVTREIYTSPAPVVENIRTLCDEYGRCWQERVATRTIVEPYATAPTIVTPRPPAVVERRVIERPTETYIERPATYVERPAATYPADTYYEAPAATYYNRTPGVTVGVGLNTY
jgi:hypothetical protein